MTKEQEQAQARNRQSAIEEKLEEMALWYVSNAPLMKDPPVIRTHKKSYRGLQYWWLEPPLPVIDNPVLVAEFIGDSWTLRIEKLGKTP